MKFLFLFYLIPIITFGQIQIGSDIDGEITEDISGYNISLSNNGSIVAVGAIWNDGNGIKSGHVRIFQNISNIWTQIGSDINGEATDDLSGYSVSLSNDGNILAIGAINNNGNGSNSGHIRIYQNSSGVWTQIGSDINGEASGDLSGYSLSLSGDGNIVAIGATNNDGNGSNSGHVRIYQNISNIWTQIGSDINGEAAGDLCGLNVSLSDNGNFVAIGAPYNDENGADSGHVRIYENSSGIWTQIGSDIDGEAAGDRSGWYVSLSNNGALVAIGALDNDGNGNNSGHVRVYRNNLGVWVQVGSDIDGEAASDQSGLSVSLSDDGNIIAISASRNDGNGVDTGHVRIYKNISNVWMQIGVDIDGEAVGDRFGSNVSLSNDGRIVAIGANRNDGNGIDAGHVRVYDLSAVLSSDEFVYYNLLIYPNPSKYNVTILLDSNIQFEKVTIYNQLGQIVKTSVNKTINTSELAKGSYYLEVITNKGKATKTLLIN